MTTIAPNSYAALGRALPPPRPQPQATPAAAGAGVADALPPGLRRILLPAARDRWLGATAASYTPARIESVLRGALTGGLTEQWMLFDLMLSTWPRLLKAQCELIRAVQNLDREFVPWTEEDEPPTPDALRRAQVCSKALWTMRPHADEDENGFDALIADLMEAWFKGITVQEVQWEVRDGGRFGLLTAPQATRWIHPRYYGYAPAAGWLGLNVVEIAQAREGLPAAPSGLSDPAALRIEDGVFARFPEHKFLVGVCKARSGPAAAGALLRPLAFWWCAANFTAEWFLNLAQLFGLPIRWANYDPSVPGLVDEVCDMLERMGSAAWGAFPAGVTLELKEAGRAGADNPQVALLERADRNCDLLVLGQTLTTDTPPSGGGTRAQGEVHYQVRADIIQAAARYVERVINEQLIPSIVWLNFGDRLATPELRLSPRAIEDTRANAETLQIASAIGVRIPARVAAKKLDIPLAAPDEEVLEPRTAALPAPAAATAPSTARAAAPAPAPGNPAQRIEQIVTQAVADGLRARRQWLAPLSAEIRRIVALARDERLTDADALRLVEAARARLPELTGELDAAAFSRHLVAVAGTAARLALEEQLA